MSSLFAKKDTNTINLLPEKEFAGSVSGRILSWIISTFRVIVIVTEILVMIAFLSRFWLDAQNTDLTEELEEKKSIISAQSTFESEFRDIQERTKLFTELTSKEGSSEYFTVISQSLPPDVTLAELSKAENELEIIGNTSNERSVQQLLVNLAATKRFGTINLQEIQTNPANNSIVTFTIKALTGKEKSS